MPPRRRRDAHLPACVYRKHGSYYLVKGNRWTRLGSTLGEALAVYARLVDKPLQTVSALLEQVLLDAAERRLAANTQRQYAQAVAQLKPILVEFAPHQVRPHHIAQILDHWRHKPAMANRARTVLKLAFDRAVRVGVCDANPVTPVQRHPEHRRERYLTDAELAAIRAAASPGLRAIIDLAYLTAQRIGDVLAIHEQHITDDGIAFQQQKTGKRLIVAWSPELRAAVDAARQVQRTSARNLLLLAHRDGRPRAYRGVRDLWARACARAGIQDAHLHDIRAKALTDADRQGLDAQQLAGHTTEAMTARYLRDRTPTLVIGPRLRQPTFS